MSNPGKNRLPIGFTILLVVSATGLNFLGAYAAQTAKLPLYLDSFCTFAVVAISGPIPGIMTALATNGILALTGPVGFPFVVCHILTVLGTWLIFRNQELDLPRFLWAGLLSALSNGIVGSIISYMLYHGVTTIPQIDTLVLGVVTACQNLSFAVLWGGLQSNLADKGLSALVAFGLWSLWLQLSKKPTPDAEHS